ncbi:MAG TPA: ornithine cyclodeaminase family protein [Candidatus Binatia bacterium]|jgi:ornithine cyclodeaminase/alanine dehydrogenase-like protein (mu-crystallin family)|nr:ornithine cyclodeaminase family protein [Candidatus Binatia bacterium]
MVLVLKNDQMENLLPMSEEIDAIEQAFRELGEGKAMNAPRARLRTPWKEEGGQYYFNNIMGLVPGVKSMALRIDSSFSKEVLVAGSKRRVYPGDFIGLVMLFDMDTCELLAIMDDHCISTMRVGATSAVASKYLARKDAKVMGLLGSGEQAKTQLTAHAVVRPLTKVKVYSPTKDNRERFAREMSRETGIQIVAVSAAEEAVRGSDIVSAATNTVEPVVEGEWLEEGMHVTSLVGGDGFLPRKELDDEAIRKANLIVVGYKPQIFLDKQAEFHDRIERGIVKPEDLHELGELLNGKCRSRTDDKEITFFKNNTGMGIQFAATARKMYEKAKEKGIGTELPLDLFMTKRGDKLYSP